MKWSLRSLAFLLFQLIVLQLINNTVVNASCVHCHFASLCHEQKDYGIKPIQALPPCCGSIYCIYIYYLIFLALRRTDQSVPPAGVCFLPRLCSHSSISKLWAPCRVKEDLALWGSQTYTTRFAAGKGGYGQTGLFWIISKFRKATIDDGAEAA